MKVLCESPPPGVTAPSPTPRVGNTYMHTSTHFSHGSMDCEKGWVGFSHEQNNMCCLE